MQTGHSNSSPKHGNAVQVDSRADSRNNSSRTLDRPFLEAGLTLSAPWETPRPFAPDPTPSSSSVGALAAPAASEAARPSRSKQKVDEDKNKRPPRPPNAWILYRSDCIQKHRENRPPGAPKPTQAELSKLFGEQWRNEPDEVKGGYERLAEAARDEHAQKYPGLSPMSWPSGLALNGFVSSFSTWSIYTVSCLKDWRFARKPIKQSPMNDARMSASSPLLLPSKLQVPLGSEQTGKRRRNTSGASSEDLTPYGTPPDYYSTGVPFSGLSDNAGQTSQLPHFTANNGFSGKRQHLMSSVSGPGMPEGSFSFPGENLTPAGNCQPGQGSHRTFPLQEGLRQQEGVRRSDGLSSTLAQRNTSAAQFYNMYDISPRSTTIHARLNTAQAETSAASACFPQSFGYSAPALPTGEANNFAYYLNDNVLPFTQPQLSLPTMPFGMTAQDINISPSHLGNVRVPCFWSRRGAGADTPTK